jgi:hypothetical protein
LPFPRGMNVICEHCDEMIVGSSYRVLSEEDGVLLLDMVVCSHCAAEAKNLQLHTEELNVGGAEAIMHERDQRARARV